MKPSTYPGFYWDREDETFRRADTDALWEGNAPTREQWDAQEAKDAVRRAERAAKRCTS